MGGFGAYLIGIYNFFTSVGSPMPFGWGGFGAGKSGQERKDGKKSPMPFGWGGFGAGAGMMKKQSG